MARYGTAGYSIGPGPLSQAIKTLIGINVLSAPVLRGEDELVAIVSVVGSIQHLADPPGEAVRDAFDPRKTFT